MYGRGWTYCNYAPNKYHLKVLFLLSKTIHSLWGGKGNRRGVIGQYSDSVHNKNLSLQKIANKKG